MTNSEEDEADTCVVFYDEICIGIVLFMIIYVVNPKRTRLFLQLKVRGGVIGLPSLVTIHFMYIGARVIFFGTLMLHR